MGGQRDGLQGYSGEESERADLERQTRNNQRKQGIKAFASGLLGVIAKDALPLLPMWFPRARSSACETPSPVFWFLARCVDSFDRTEAQRHKGFSLGKHVTEPLQNIFTFYKTGECHIF